MDVKLNQVKYWEKPKGEKELLDQKGANSIRKQKIARDKNQQQMYYFE
jgi:hypothetical protein